ncbi:MAG: hypothetical protein ABF337_04020, partial [Akkermansiaceae bacterium]
SVTVRDDLRRTISSTNENNETISKGYQLETSWMITLTNPDNPVEKDHDSVQRLETKRRVFDYGFFCKPARFFNSAI